VLFEGQDELLAGLNNVGTIHFARFTVVAGNLCMFSEYDGEFTAYIRDFIGMIGNAFDALMPHLKNAPTTPVEENADEFVEWIRQRDTFQMPESPTYLSTGTIASLQRSALVTLHRNPNVQLALYRAYPGFSVAQIRDELSLGW